MSSKLIKKSRRPRVLESFSKFNTVLKAVLDSKGHKAVLFVSPSNQEERSEAIILTAFARAREGGTVLVIDGNIRKPLIHTLMEVSNDVGITEVLQPPGIGRKPVLFKDAVKIYGKISLLAAGNDRPDPVELFGSEGFRTLLDTARAEYDLVLIDAAPMSNVTDAGMISQLVDGVVLVMAAGKTRREQALQTKKTLKTIGANVLGVLFTEKAAGFRNSKEDN